MNYLEPGNIAGKHIRNRTVVAAMTNQQSGDDGRLSDAEYNWLVARAAGGFGIVTTCAASVHPGGRSWPGQLGIHSDEHLPGLRRLAAGIRAEGALAVAQIHHGGYRAPRAVSGVPPVSATEFSIDAEGFETPRMLETGEVEELVQAFVAAALRAEEAGFDGVEFHGAHTYLITQFLSAEINTRTDTWGGNLDNRYRFLSECLRRTRRRCSSDFLLGVRLSPGVPRAHAGISLAECLRIAPWIVKDGADFLHLSLRDAAGKTTPAADNDRHGKNAVPAFRSVLPVGFPLITCGGIQSHQDAHDALALGADAVAMARAAIGNKEWPRLDVDPVHPPFSKEDLRDNQAVSSVFLDYLQRFPNLLA